MRHLPLPRASSALLAAIGCSLLVPATGQAALQTFGSDLSAPADTTQARQADTVYWQKAFADGRSPLVPAQGQIKEIRLKGYAKSDREPGALGGGGETLFHFQSLQPMPDGSASVLKTSQFFDVPNAALGNPDTITTYAPENLCVDPGQVVAFNTIGGWDGVANRDPGNGPVGKYPDGTPFQIFSAVTRAVTSEFTGDNQTNNGATVRPAPGKGVNQELLMQMTLATGDDRSYECGGPNTYRPADPPRRGGGAGSSAPKPQLATIPGVRMGISSKGLTTVGLYCQSGPTACVGEVTVVAKGLVLAKARFNLPAGKTSSVKLKLSKAGFRLFKKNKRKLRGTVTAVLATGARSTKPLALKARGK